MDELFADEVQLRDMLERALVSEPPLGSVVRGAVRAGVRRRRRRRVAGAVAGLAVVAAAFTPDGKVAYAVNRDSGTVTPIEVAAGSAHLAIKVGRTPAVIAITPDGRVAYVSSASGTVTPIDIRTQTARAAIKVGGEPVALVIAP